MSHEVFVAAVAFLVIYICTFLMGMLLGAKPNPGPSLRKLQSLGKRIATHEYAAAVMLLNRSTWEQLPQRTRRTVRKAIKREVKLTESQDMEPLRAIRRAHYPELPELPELEDHQALYYARVDDEIIAGLVVDVVGRALLYRWGASSPLGRESGAMSLLFWNMVERYEGRCEYFYVGWSSDPNIQKFKDQWASFLAPVPADFFSFLPSRKPVGQILVIRRYS